MRVRRQNRVPCTYPIKVAATPQSLKSSAVSYTSYLWIYQPGIKPTSKRTSFKIYGDLEKRKIVDKKFAVWTKNDGVNDGELT